MDTKIKTILIADDHPLILDGLIKQIETEPLFKIIAKANSGKEAWKLYLEKNPDICIFDIEMGEMDGIKLTEEIKKLNPNTKIILITMHTSPWIISKAMEAKPNSILLKHMSANKIMTAIHEVLESGNYLPNEVDHILHNQSREIKSILSVSGRESEVLQLIACGNTTQQIAEKLCLSVNTIETYRKNLLLKFETPNVAGLVKKATELGII